MDNWIECFDKIVDAGKKVKRLGAVNNILNEIEKLVDKGR